MKKVLLCLAILIIPILIEARNVNAESEYVAWIGDVGFTSLHEATEAAVDGDIITLGEGEYSLYGFAHSVRVGKTLTFVGQGPDKTKWYVGAAVPESGGTINYNADYSMDGTEKATFKNMTIQLGTKDYLGFVRLNHAVFENCVINGKMEYNGYESATFRNSTLNCPNNDYCIWTYSSPEITFDGCTFNSSGKTINVYSNASNIGERDIIVNFHNNTINGNSTGKAALNINDSNRTENSKFIINISGVNETDNLLLDDLSKGKLQKNTTCSKVFEFGRDTYNTGKTIVNVDGTVSWMNGGRQSFDYVVDYSDADVSIIESDWEYDTSHDYYEETVTKSCPVCGIFDEEHLIGYTVTYTDGIDDDEAFRDQSFVVEEGNATPTFDAVIKRGYVLKGWNSQIADIVTQNVTYVAILEREAIPDDEDGDDTGSDVAEEDNDGEIVVPFTGDNISFYVLIFSLSTTGFVMAGLYAKKLFHSPSN